MSGNTMEIGVEPGWRVLEAKKKLANKTSIPVREQCWAFGQEILPNTGFMSDVQTIGTLIEVSMVRRDPEVAEWLERIEADWTWVKSQGIQAIPAKVWKSSDSADLINGVFHLYVHFLIVIMRSCEIWNAHRNYPICLWHLVEHAIEVKSD